MLSSLRGAVSKEKRRYQQFGFDLDMSYITRRIVAMGFPSESVEAAYRNPYKEVYRFFETFHKDHYKVYNLCSERGYEASKFHNRVSVYPFDDHNAPPFELIQKFCADVDEYLGQDAANIAVVHCKAGKGRTGLMICAYMLHIREWETSDEALLYYAAIRTFDKKGVTIPSQVRYVKYYEQAVRFGIQVGKELVFLKRVVLRPKPKLPDNAELSFKIFVAQTMVYKSTKGDEEMQSRAKRSTWADCCSRDGTTAGLRMRDALIEGGEVESRLDDTFDIVTVYTSKREPDGAASAGGWTDEPHVAELPNVPLCGDICLEAYSRVGLAAGEQHLFSFWFNTAFVRNNRAVFAKPELDKAHKDKKVFAPHFVVETFFNDALSLSAAAIAAAASASPTPAAAAAAAAGAAAGAALAGGDGGAAAAPTVLAQLLSPAQSAGGTLAQIGALNVALGPFPSGVTPRGATVVAAELLERLLDLYLRCGFLGICLDDSVASVAHHADFPAWQRAASELERVSVTMLRENDERTAFWLNVYNIVALHSTALLHSRRDMNKPLCSSAKDKAAQLQDARYIIAGHAISMAEIENAVLRPALPAAENGIELAHSFADTDERRHWTVMVRDTRIAYAISYCTTSSPKIWVYHAGSLHQELDRAVATYLREASYVVPQARQAYLPRQCQWFARDFAKRREQLEYFGRILECPGLSDYDVRYSEYDWELRVYLDHLRLCGIPVERRAQRVVASMGPPISPFSAAAAAPQQQEEAAPQVRPELVVTPPPGEEAAEVKPSEKSQEKKRSSHRSSSSKGHRHRHKGAESPKESSDTAPLTPPSPR